MQFFQPSSSLRVITYCHTLDNVTLTFMQKKNETEENAKVVAAVLGTYLNFTLAIYQQGWLEEKFLEENPFIPKSFWW